MPTSPKITIDALLPSNARILLTGGGKEFIERIGVDAARDVVLGILSGENVRGQTEPLTRRRLAQVTGALILLFLNGLTEDPDFIAKLPALALEQMETARRNDRVKVWTAQWLMGLTDKAVQNVLRGNSQTRKQYLADFEEAVSDAARQNRENFGDLKMTLALVETPNGQAQELDWKGITLLSTAIGSATLAIRGSDKSMYGKLFERLVLGSVLTLLGFEHTSALRPARDNKVFWLSDSRDMRECDATILLEPGKILRFDIGFIGQGNPEIVRDKLTRFASKIERDGQAFGSRSFIIIDRLPAAGNTRQIAAQVDADILQMSMQFWPRELALLLRERSRYNHPLCDIADADMPGYLSENLASVPIQNFLTGVSAATLLDTQTDEEASNE